MEAPFHKLKKKKNPFYQAGFRSISGNHNNTNFHNTMSGLPSKHKHRTALKRALSNVSDLSHKAVADGTISDSNDNPSNYHLDMSSSSIDRHFEDMLDEMNMDEPSRAPLREKTLEEKVKILQLQTSLPASNIELADSFILSLRDPNIKTEKLMDLLSKLLISLRSSPVSWVRYFDSDKCLGLSLLLDHLIASLSTTSRHAPDTKLALNCIRCIRAFGNSGYGLDRLLMHETAATYIARCLMPDCAEMMLRAVELLTAMAMTGLAGHHSVLDGMTMTAELMHYAQGSLDRFQPILQGLMHQKSPALRQACMQFINVIVNPPFASDEELELDFRIHLRFEFYGLGLKQLLQALRANQDETLSYHASLFESQAEADQAELLGRFDMMRLELNDIHECFRLLSRGVLDTPVERYLLSILQHLLMIGEEPRTRVHCFRIIEECVAQIVLQRGRSYDPDPRCHSLKVDISNLLDRMADIPQDLQPGKVKDLQFRLDRAIQEKQETEAKLESLMGKFNFTQSELETLKLNMNWSDILNNGDSSLKASASFLSGRKSGSPLKRLAPAPPPPAPPPPPILPSQGDIFRPPAPPPPPPMLPSNYGPGNPPQPPPTGPIRPQNLPFGIKPKKLYRSEVPMKKPNWTPINLSNLDRSSLWVSLNEDKMVTDELLKNLQENFSTKPVSNKFSTLKLRQDNQTDSLTSLLSVKSLNMVKREARILDAKTASNLGLIIGALKMPLENLRNVIDNLDDVSLSPTMIEQLMKTLPDQSVMPKFSDLKEDYKSLVESEQLCCLLSSVKRLHARLHFMYYRTKFPELLSEVKPDIVAVTEALREIQTSRRLSTLFELILLFGNILNSGSRNGQAVGFELSFLPKMASTKDQTNRRTLMHFLVEYIEKQYPTLLKTFEEDLSYLDKASRVSEEVVSQSVSSLNEMTKRLEADYKAAKSAANDPSFTWNANQLLEQSREQLEVATKMLYKMQETFKQVSKYLAFDSKKYPLESLFSDLATFKEHFHRAMQDNATHKATEERIRRAHEEQKRKKRESEARRAQLPRKSIGNSKEGGEDEEGLMDALLLSLKKGSHYSSPVERRQRMNAHRAKKSSRDVSTERKERDSGDVARILCFDEDENASPIDAQSLMERIKRL